MAISMTALLAIGACLGMIISLLIRGSSNKRNNDDNCKQNHEYKHKKKHRYNANSNSTAKEVSRHNKNNNVSSSFQKLWEYLSPRNNKYNETEQQRKEREAKASFRVRRSNLMSISGYNKNHSTDHRRYQSKNKFQRRDGNKGWGHGSSHDNFSSVNRRTFGDLLHSWFVKLTYPLTEVIYNMLSTIFPGYFSTHNSSSPSSLSFPQYSKNSTQHIIMAEGYYDDVVVLGLDCEMVGGGRGGMVSLLARCSVVTLDHIPIDLNSDEEKANEDFKMQKNNEPHKEATIIQLKSEGQASKTESKMKQHTTKKTHTTTSPAKLTNLNQNLVVLYDKYVIPKGKITDYRTQWSGITKDTLFGDSKKRDIPIVSFDQCQKEVSLLFSSKSHGGKKVIVAGHALSNDFDALEIKVSLDNATPVMHFD